MTTYILRADDREWQLSSRLAREIRIEAFNILFREEILQGTVWSQSVSRKNGMRALWVIDISYKSFSKAVPTPTDPPIEWKKLTHAMACDAWDDGIVIDKELFEEDNIRKILDEEFDWCDVDRESRCVRWVKPTVGPNEFDSDFCYYAYGKKVQGSFPVWWFDYKLKKVAA